MTDRDKEATPELEHELPHQVLCAVVAIAVSGSTFAAWSDFGQEATGAGAGMLRLNIGDQAVGGVAPFSLAPGQEEYREFYLANADEQNVPDGALSVKIENFVDIEDGCTTASERVEEGGNGCGSTGELDDEAIMTIRASDPVANQDDCVVPGIYNQTDPRARGPLAAIAGNSYAIRGGVGPGEGVCVQMYMWLPETATNASQGDEASWDWRFDLDQVTP